ncbi:alkaline phosphatase [Halomonas sp. M20]|uniref:alkaline phosphatase n=1 Tax=Halomonas sp. M20 TaxID=2763264 RepID=UPI001D0B0E17|nr:alkaline phosphatase [Halomonas sp. M20]
MYHIIAILFALNILLLGLRYLMEGRLEAVFLAWEAVWLTALLLILPERGRPWLIKLIVSGLALLFLLASLDVLTRLSFGRRFNFLLDFGLADSAFHQLTQNMGIFVTLIVLAFTAAILFLGIWLVARCFAALRLPVLTRQKRLALGLLLCGLLATSLAGPKLLPYFSTPGLNLITTHWRQMQETHRAYADFKRAVTDEHPLKVRPLPALAGRDVILGFIESYGVTALFDQRYAPTIKPRLAEFEQRLKRSGIHMASAKLISPVQGGQSWLAHATLLSGLSITTQRHYELMLSQRQSTLNDDFRKTGHRNLAIMPGLTQPWPQGRQLGYDHVFTARNIPYSGPSLNWVTMPDQYTWRFFESQRQTYEPPLFAELALISSHAPWTPILPIVDWESLEHSSVLEQWTALKKEAETPEELWQDLDRVRVHYARALDYALAAALGYAERYLEDDALLVLLGDHQPAPLITGKNASREVPVHVLSRDKNVVTPFIDAGFTSGLIPREQSSKRAMADFRPLLHRLFGH